MMANRSASTRNRGTGFTLIELLIVVVIAAILVSIAIPVYTYETRTSRRTEAKTAVLDLASREESYFSTNNQYSTDPTLLGYAPIGSGAVFPQSTGNYYQITVTVPNPAWAGGGPSYIVTATPSPGSPQLQDTACTAFSVTQTGSQTATGTLGNACWQ